MKLIDLSQQLQHGSLSYPGTTSGVSIDHLDTDVEGITVSVLDTFDPHCGTHYDAPLHFVPGALDVASAPLVLPEVVLLSSAISPIPPEVLDGLLSSLEGRAVLFSTGWEQHAATQAFFKDFPVLSKELAIRLIQQRVALVGIDSPSVDGAVSSYPVHRALLSAGIPILEGLVNLRALIEPIENASRVRLAAFPLRILGLEGSPVRAVALVE